MIRFILHSILILVITQLSNVAMGLIMNESQHTNDICHFSQIQDSINNNKYFDFQNQHSSPLIRTSQISMTRSELPFRIRVMLNGVFKQTQEYSILNKKTTQTRIHDVFISQPKRYFHELCSLII